MWISFNCRISEISVNLYFPAKHLLVLSLMPNSKSNEMMGMLMLKQKQWSLGIQFSSVQFSCSVVSDFLQPHGLQHARPPCPSPTPKAYTNSCPLGCDAIQPSLPLSSASPPALTLSQHKGLFEWVSSSYQVAKVLEFQLQHQSFQRTLRTDLL